MLSLPNRERHRPFRLSTMILKFSLTYVVYTLIVSYNPDFSECHGKFLNAEYIVI